MCVVGVGEGVGVGGGGVLTNDSKWEDRKHFFLTSSLYLSKKYIIFSEDRKTSFSQNQEILYAVHVISY